MKVWALAFLFLIQSLLLWSQAGEIRIYFDPNEPSIVFAANELGEVLKNKGDTVVLESLTENKYPSEGIEVVIAMDIPVVRDALSLAGGAGPDTLEAQEYALRITENKNGRCYWIIGGDRVGAMYGGIQLGESVRAFGLDSIKEGDHAPYIARRGIKFNIPLGERQPSHDDSGTSAQSNIVHMWDFSFWTEYLDLLAKQHYNVLSLWNQHPFPSMIRLEDYPDVAMDDVYNKAGKVKEISIDEKIALWKKIMDYAYDRGIEIYWIVWNIHMNGASGKHGITEDGMNPVTKDYLRKSVEALFLTYPRLAGIGVTAGENMGEMSADEKEAWMWDTYGIGVQNVHKLQKDRHIRFIHRYWWTSFDLIESRFSQLKDGFDMSFKYARAKMYAAFDPPFAEKELLPVLPAHIATWWNIRNDDIYNLRWGNPEYARQFILHLPRGERTAGYYMGSDRFVWGRESISKHPASPRVLENVKHWYSFLLWGRLGYDPETPDSFFRGLIRDRFPGVAAEDLFSAWSAASEIIPLVNKFHWFSWDYLWWPEAGISTGYGVAIKGYHDVNDFINAPVMDGSYLLTIKEYAEAVRENGNTQGTTPLEVADRLETYANTALENIEHIVEGEDFELSETLGDIRAMAFLGNYYGAKIRGATYLELYRQTGKRIHKQQAVENLERSLLNWQAYARNLDKRYIKMHISMHGLFDWDTIEREVREDIHIAKTTSL